MIDLTVVFKVPEWLATGLGNGELERIGGVIREKLTKKVVAWLREGDMVSTEPPSETLNGQMSKLMMQGQVLMGLQVANLAVSAVGFTIIFRKLQRIERQLGEVNSKLSQLQAGQDWLHTKQLLEQLTPISSAMRSLQEAPSYREHRHAEHKLLTADESFLKAQTYFHQVLLNLLDKKQEYQRAEEFTIGYRAWLLAGQGRMQAMSELGEQQVALGVAKSLKSEHTLLGKRLTETLGDPIRRLSAGKDTDSASSIMQKLAQQAAQADQILRGNVLQLNFMQEHDLLPTHERNATPKGHSGLLICMPT